MSMTYCICKRCGEELLLDDMTIAQRGGYLCDECFGEHVTYPDKNQDTAKRAVKEG